MVLFLSLLVHKNLHRLEGVPELVFQVEQYYFVWKVKREEQSVCLLSTSEVPVHHTIESHTSAQV